MQKTAPRPLPARISFLSASVLGLGAAVASRGAVFVSNILLAHSLTVHDFGLFSYAYVTALNLGLFLATGVSQAAGHVLPLIENPERKRRQLCAFIVLLVALIAVAAAALYLSSASISVAAFGSEQGSGALRMAAIVLIATAFTQALQSFQYAMHEHRSSATISIGAAVLLLTMLWAMGPIRQPALALTIFLAVNAGAAVSQLLVLARATPSQRGPWRTGREELRLAVKHALPSVLTTSMGAPIHWICLSMLAAMTDGAHQLALFSVAFQWYIAITFIPATLGNLALPFLARHAGATEATVRQRFRSALLFGGGLSLALGCASFLLAGEIFAWFYPADYGSAASSMRSLSVAAALCGVSVLLQQRIAAAGKFWRNFAMAAVYSVIYVAASYIALRLGFGATSIGLAMSAAYCCLILFQTLTLQGDSGAAIRLGRSFS
ncbi:multidrug MFS transporter [Ralstonia solanacearum]|uniref:Multidrug MFS transporter n=1 Tax=Ralstonia solanacearum TaxID=305 RepID=A0AAW5ZIR4_RALSL|nr:multidrug MFS transporter [Ralstonia solanacearum]MDB0569846.1 multidrug MFS transporter [Ralstonia solanacearum]